MNIDIDLKKTYEITLLADKADEFSFFSPTTQGHSQLITVKIKRASNPFMPEFLNLAFGPLGKDGVIDDFATVQHANYSKTFSTILLCAMICLRANPDLYIGIDGSDFRRAYLYFRTLQRNYHYLKQYFHIFGMKYYVRILRGQDKHDQMPIDPEELTSVPFVINNEPLTNHKSLYNYFIFYLNL
jgi:hypothetical protein